jgi:hypothetical protein
VDSAGPQWHSWSSFFHSRNKSRRRYRSSCSFDCCNCFISRMARHSSFHCRLPCFHNSVVRGEESTRPAYRPPVVADHGRRQSIRTPSGTARVAIIIVRRLCYTTNRRTTGIDQHRVNDPLLRYGGNVEPNGHPGRFHGL